MPTDPTGPSAAPTGGTVHDSWVERDAAVVWHGFTQMAAYGTNRPVVVDRAEGHEIIDVDGRRYLDAISSLWVTTLGHRVPELDDALRQQIDRGAHTTLLGNGNRIVIELSEALRARVPVDDAHVLYASDGACAVEQALKIAWQYHVNGGTPRSSFLAFGGAYHGDTLGALSVGDRGFGTDIFDPLTFPVLRAPAFDDPDCFDRACAMVDEGDPQGELSMAGAMAKCFASDVAMQVTTDCVQFLGGYGYTDEFPVERMMRDAKITQIYEGTNQIQRMVISKKLGL